MISDPTPYPPAVFIHEDTTSFVVDCRNQLWEIDVFFDADGDECGPEDALSAVVFNKRGVYSVVDLTRAHHPQVH